MARRWQVLDLLTLAAWIMFTIGILVDARHRRATRFWVEE